VIATEKKAASPLVDDSSLEKVSLICDNIGVVYSGMGPDARLLVSKARKAAQQYKRVYQENPPTLMLVRDMGDV
jgi:20S proteasome subunit alpha 2